MFLSIRDAIPVILMSLCLGIGTANAEDSLVGEDILSFAEHLASGETGIAMASRVERIVTTRIMTGSSKALSRVDMPEAIDVALAYSIGSGEPRIAFVCGISSLGEMPWSEALWLAILDRLSRLDSPWGGTVYLFLVDESLASAQALSHEFPIGRDEFILTSISDMGVEAILLLDYKLPPTGLALGAASLRRMSPRAVVEAVRKAGEASGIRIKESPVYDFYASVGLASGSMVLAPWLEAGLPAVVIGSPGTRPGVEEDAARESIDIVAFFEAFARGSLSTKAGMPAGKLLGEDVNYIRYPLPDGSLIIPDHIITCLTLMAIALVALGFALGFLKREVRGAQFRAVLREAMSAIVLSMVALFGSNMLATIALRLAGFPEGRGAYISDSMSSWNSALSLVLRFLCALSVYYVASGTASGLKLMGRHRRIDAARASLVLLCINLLLAVAIVPAAAPFFILALVVCALSSNTVLTTALGLLLVVLFYIPFLDPRVISNMAYYAAGSGSVAATLLRAEAKGTLAIGAFAAPFGLWLAAASSPEARLSRGRRTLLLWILAALALAAAEALLGKAMTGV